MADKKVCVWQLWHDYCQSTGCHGVNKLSAMSQGSKIRIVVWMTIILSLTSYMTYTIIRELRCFYSYPTMMTMYTLPLNHMEFPAITVCNLNSLNKSAIKNDSRVNDFLLKSSPLSIYSNISINWTDPFYRNEGFYLNRTKEAILKEHKELLGKFLVLSAFDLKFLNITEYFTTKITTYGPCITSNPDKILQARHAGSVLSMNLWFDLDGPNNYYGRWLGEGLLLMIHSRREQPELHDLGGYFVRPGSEVFAAVTKTEFEYLPSPYQAMPNVYCRDTKNPDGTEYTMRTCFKECFVRLMYNECNCISFTYNNTYYCSKYDEVNCAYNTYTKFINDTIIMDSCDCQMSCQFTRYEATVTSAIYPSEFYSHLAEEVLGYRDVDYYRNNYINLHIYFDQLKTTIAKQVPKYSSAGDIFANLGGQMGLFLGASLITATELAEFILFLLLVLVRKVLKKETRVQNIAPGGKT